MRVHRGPVTLGLAARLYADILSRTDADWPGLPVLRRILRDALGLDDQELARLETGADVLWERWLETGQRPLPPPRHHPLR